MSINAATLNNTIAGVVVKTTHLYARYLTFTKIVGYIVMAVNETEPDADGVIRYSYESKVKTTNPYRTLMLKYHAVPNQWLEVSDFPAGGHMGLIAVQFENFHRFPEQPKIRKHKETGIQYEIVPPEGYEK